MPCDTIFHLTPLLKRQRLYPLRQGKRQSLHPPSAIRHSPTTISCPSGAMPIAPPALRPSSYSCHENPEKRALDKRLHSVEESRIPSYVRRDSDSGSKIRIGRSLEAAYSLR